MVISYFKIQFRSSIFTVKQLTQYVAYPIQGFGASYTEVVAAKSVKDKIFSMIDSHKKTENKRASSMEKVFINW